MLAYKILVKPISDSVRFEKLLERDKVTIEYLKLRDKASIEYNEEDFNYIICNNYVEEKNNEHIKFIKEDINHCIQFEALGTKSPFALPNSACPSYYLKINDTKILLDCGSGSHRFFNMNNLENLNIIISHLHRDHYNDLFNYMYSSYSLKNLGLLKEKFNIYIPDSPTRIAEDIKLENLTFSNVKAYNKTTKLKINNINIEFLEVAHAEDMNCYAIKLCAPNKTIVYSGDVSYSNKQKLLKFAKNCDVLICEASLLKKHNFKEINSHLTAEQAATIAKEANAKKLLLTHFWAEENLDNYKNEANKIFNNTVVLKEQETFYL